MPRQRLATTGRQKQRQRRSIGLAREPTTDHSAHCLRRHRIDANAVLGPHRRIISRHGRQCCLCRRCEGACMGIRPARHHADMENEALRLHQAHAIGGHARDQARRRQHFRYPSFDRVEIAGVGRAHVERHHVDHRIDPAVQRHGPARECHDLVGTRQRALMQVEVFCNRRQHLAEGRYFGGFGIDLHDQPCAVFGECARNIDSLFGCHAGDQHAPAAQLRIGRPEETIVRLGGRHQHGQTPNEPSGRRSASQRAHVVPIRLTRGKCPSDSGSARAALRRWQERSALHAARLFQHVDGGGERRPSPAQHVVRHGVA